MQPTEQRLKVLEQEIERIKLRNKKVEADKAWETSLFRKVTLAVMTYLVMTLFMYVIEVKDFYISAIIPTLGFLLSTLSLPIIKNFWVKKR